MTSQLPFQWHLEELVVIVVAGVWHRVKVRDPRQRRLGLVGFLALLVVTMWPVGDLAASVSLSVLTVQRLVIMLFVAPMLMLATPTWVFARLSRPAPLDALMRVLAHPGAAVAIVTAAGTATLLAPVVDWGAHSWYARDTVVLATLGVGIVLWLPALAILPGTTRLSPMGRAGYVFVSSLTVTSLSFVWIFARHPLYSALHYQRALLHMTPLLDQQLAGFIAKFGCYFPMWAVAFTIFSRAEREGIAVEESPLHWADVERELLRAERREARERRRESS